MTELDYMSFFKVKDLWWSSRQWSVSLLLDFPGSNFGPGRGPSRNAVFGTADRTVILQK